MHYCLTNNSPHIGQHFSRNPANVSVSSDSLAKFLSGIVNEHLSWKPHINRLLKKLAQSCLPSVSLRTHAVRKSSLTSTEHILST